MLFKQVTEGFTNGQPMCSAALAYTPGPLVYCIIFLWKVMFSQIGIHSPGPFVFPIPSPEHPLISEDSSTHSSIVE